MSKTTTTTTTTNNELAQLELNDSHWFGTGASRNDALAELKRQINDYVESNVDYERVDIPADKIRIERTTYIARCELDTGLVFSGASDYPDFALAELKRQIDDYVERNASYR